MILLRGTIRCMATSKTLLKAHNTKINTFRLVSTYSFEFREQWKKGRFTWLKFSSAAAIVAGIVYCSRSKAESKSVDSLPTFKLSEVAKHCDKEHGVWVTYQGAVYDITKFVDQHPGGKKILLAAGGNVEPYWAIYGVHNNVDVRAILEDYKIGHLSHNDLVEQESVLTPDPFSNDPKRHPALRPASVKPYNAEPPPSLLVDNFNTPNDIFYVRNHMPVPDLDPKTFLLEVVDINCRKCTLTLDDIKKLPKVTVNATVMCAGNRRSEMSKVKPVKGLTWRQAAVGNAEWSGARLVDLLSFYGIETTGNIRHVHFEGLDSGPDGVAYAASVPAETALDPNHDVLLAYEMNGEPLPRDHGAPIRVVVPGVVGARNVKWLGRVVLSEQESDSHWQQNDYKGLPPGMDWDNIDFTIAPAIQELPVISAICSPEEGDVVELVDGCIQVQGYAWSGGGRKVVRVDVSCDKGQTWHVAELNQGSQSISRHWSWSLWSSTIPIEPNDGEAEVWVKAVDSAYNSQPESFEHIWNLRGVLSNAYHKIKVKIV